MPALHALAAAPAIIEHRGDAVRSHGFVPPSPSGATGACARRARLSCQRLTKLTPGYSGYHKVATYSFPPPYSAL